MNSPPKYHDTDMLSKQITLIFICQSAETHHKSIWCIEKSSCWSESKLRTWPPACSHHNSSFNRSKWWDTRENSLQASGLFNVELCCQWYCFVGYERNFRFAFSSRGLANWFRDTNKYERKWSDKQPSYWHTGWPVGEQVSNSSKWPCQQRPGVEFLQY